MFQKNNHTLCGVTALLFQFCFKIEIARADV